MRPQKWRYRHGFATEEEARSFLAAREAEFNEPAPADGWGDERARGVLTEADLVPCTICSLRGHTAENCDLPERHQLIRTGRRGQDIL